LVHQEEIIAMLECGTERWNEFRRQHSDGFVLNGASLPDAQLARADLHSVILIESDLPRANLACASLEQAVLRKTNLRGSDLRQANMDRADLFRANLSGADLRDASLVSSFLKCTDLRGTDLSTARGLTEAQIRDALGDDRTKLPSGMVRPATWGSEIVRD
jgi:uncharacterized protein YjbI with pentapeptide repeats